MLPHLECLFIASKELNFKIDFIDRNHNFLRISKDADYLDFINTTTPFNTEIVAKICKDKGFCYQLLHQHINTPKTLDYLDPMVDTKYSQYISFETYQAITQDIIAQFGYVPIVIKPNAKAQGVNVTIARDYNQILNSVETIFDKSRRGYDFVLLAQEYIKIKSEFRVVCFKQKIVLVYLKDTSKASFNGNLSPLHWDNARAVYITDETIIKNIEKFIAPIFQNIDLVYAGLDIALDCENNWWLIEINTHPGFQKFLDNNPNQLLIDMYRQILVDYYEGL